MGPCVRRDDIAAVSALPRIRLQSGGLDAGDRADLVIVGGIAADADRANQHAAILDQHATGNRRGKYAMRAIASMSFDESIAYTESQIALLAMTEDAKEGLKAFGEKRKPAWPGK
jgi:enoyl-CoA hydratase/carnithine racemase